MSSPDCLFCRISRGEIPSTAVHQNDRFYAFRDIDPKAPTHILVIPKAHVASLDAATDATYVSYKVVGGAEFDPANMFDNYSGTWRVQIPQLVKVPS